MIIDIHIAVKFRALGFTLAQFQAAWSATYESGSVRLKAKVFNPIISKPPVLDRNGVKLWVY